MGVLFKWRSGADALKACAAVCLLFVMPLLCGCIVVSAGPYYTDDAVVTFPEIAGEWRMIKNEENMKLSSARPWVFLADSILTFDGEGRPGMLRAVYFRIGETVFLDTTVEKEERAVNGWRDLHTMPMHITAKIEIQGDRLKLVPLDYEWLDEAVRGNTVTLPHVRLVDNTDFFTAQPQRWMEFLKEYRDDRGAFSGRHALTFVRCKCECGK